MSIRLSCPSCNSAFVLASLPDSRRAACPRCCEAFPIRTYTDEADDGPQMPVTIANAKNASRTQGEGRRMLGVLVVAGLLIVLAGFPPFLALLKPPKNKPQAPVPVSAAAKPLSQLVALGYLRADCNIVFAVQPGPLLAYAERTKQQPRDVLSQTGLPDAARNVIEQVGVELTQIDHIAGGVTVGDGEDAFRFALLLVLRQPLADEGEFLTKLKAKPVAGKKSHHDVVAGKLSLLLTRVSPIVWAFGFNDKDLDAVEKGGHGSGGAHLRGLQTVLAAVPPEAAVWLAANDERDWTQKPIMKLVGQSTEGRKWLPVVKDGRGGLVAVSFAEQPRLKVQVRAADDATGDRVRAYFAARTAETAQATPGGSGTLAQFEAPFDGAHTGKLLQRFLSDAGK